MIAQGGLEATAHAMQGEPALGVGGRRLGPGRQVVHASPPVGRTFEAATHAVQYSPSPEGGCVDPGDRHRDALGGPALQIEEASLDHLLGLQPDFGVGLIGVGVELGPADAVARCQGDGHELDRSATTTFGAQSRRNWPDPSASAWPITTGLNPSWTEATLRPLEPRVNHHGRIWHRLALRVEHAADHEHPAWRRALAVSSGLAASGGCEAAGVFLGSSFMARE